MSNWWILFFITLIQSTPTNLNLSEIGIAISDIFFRRQFSLGNNRLYQQVEKYHSIQCKRLFNRNQCIVYVSWLGMWLQIQYHSFANVLR